MKRKQNQKGITIVALIISIIILLILAVVTIRAVTGDGIIAHAKNTRDQYEQKAAEENALLANLAEHMAGQVGGENTIDPNPVEPEDPTPTITTAHLNTVLSTKENTKLKDKYENQITVPAGFKIVVDNSSDASKSTNYTADTINVTKGIVIEDENQNQFVWIPIGENITNGTKTKNITLGRYSWIGYDATLEQPIVDNSAKGPTSEVAISRYYTNKYTELQPTENGKGPNGNAIARNINHFYEGSIQNGGYYIGRYEVSQSGTTIACKANQDVYNSMTQPQASEKVKTMYIDGFTSGTFSSDLMNGYAWDTAIVFIQTFGTETYAFNYGNKNFSNGFKQTGANQVDNKPDKFCNIYDLSGNAGEWTTESTSNLENSCAWRGGKAYGTTILGVTKDAVNEVGPSSYTSSLGARPVLYLALNS